MVTINTHCSVVDLISYRLQILLKNMPFDIKKCCAEYKNILVVDFGGIGDLILAIPFLKGLKNSFLASAISVLCARRAGDILKCQPYFDYRYDSNMTSLDLLNAALQLRKKSLISVLI